jgi:serine protease
VVYRDAFKEYVFESRGIVTIPDGEVAGVESAVHVDVPGQLRQIDVVVQVRHPSFGDLLITLVGPDGVEVLLSHQAYSASQEVELHFESTTHKGIASLLGKPARGKWALRLKDLVSVDEGSLLHWSLTVEVATPP